MSALKKVGNSNWFKIKFRDVRAHSWITGMFIVNILLIIVLLLSIFRVLDAKKRITKEKGTSDWTLFAPYFQMLAGIGAGCIALYTYKESHKQKQEHFNRDALDKQFIDILDRCINEDTATRIAALMRLGEMAIKIDPIDKARNSSLTLPYFHRAISQLSATMYLEPNDLIRNKAMNIIRDLLNYFGGELENQEFVRVIIAELGYANGSASDKFLDVLDVYLRKMKVPNHSSEEEILKSFSWVINSDNPYDVVNKKLSSSCLLSRRNPELVDIVTISYNERLSHSDEDLYLDCILSGKKLTDCSFILAYSFKFIKNFNDVKGKQIQIEKRVLALQGCFLSGYDCSNLHLDGIDFHDSYLAYTDFHGSSLVGANFNRAILENVDLSECMVSGASFIGANMRNIKLYGLKFDKSSKDSKDLPNFSNAKIYGLNPRNSTMDLYDTELVGWLNSKFPVEMGIPASCNM